MNTQYHTIDGATFSAVDATDLMTQLRADSFNPEDDLPSYCRATARASKMQTGKPHRAWPPKALVEDICHGATSRPWLSGVRRKKTHFFAHRFTHEACQFII